MSQQFRSRLKKFKWLEERLIEDAKRLREEDRLLKLSVACVQVLRKAPASRDRRARHRVAAISPTAAAEVGAA
jgi:hypothetical protein